LAFQVYGSGPVDLVLVLPMAQNIEMAWEMPLWRRWFEALGSFCRVVHFDKRGTGASDRSAEAPSLDTRVDDTVAVMDAAGFDHAFLYGISEGGTTTMMLAVTYPHRVDGLILDATAAHFPALADTGTREQINEVVECWGTERSLFRVIAPSLPDDDETRALHTRYERASATPGALRDLFFLQEGIDVRAILPDIAVPTIARHNPSDKVAAIERARETVAAIPGARLFEYDSPDHWSYIGPDVDAWLEEVRMFLGESTAIELPPLLPRYRRTASVRTLGGFAVRLGDDEVPTSAWGSRRSRQLCKRLAIAGGDPVPREQLFELLWPDDVDSGRLGARLSVQLSTVRRILGGGVIADRSSIRLDVGQVNVDVVELHTAAAAGDVERVASLYQGELLPEDLYEDWASAPRERARAAFVAATRTLADAASGVGDHVRALELAQRLLATDAYDDDAYQRVIGALIRLRRLGDAERMHGRYVQRMQELGVHATPFDNLLAGA
jgi:pimeloyl-ACP methyl ester carboxylesterase/DNA-binding SARP family transcriptional activator